MFLTAKHLRSLRLRHGLAGLLVATGLFAINAGAAPPSAPIEAKRGELRELHNRLEKLHQELSKTEENKAYAADQLKETESSISNVNRNLRELATQREVTETALGALQKQSNRLEGQIRAQQEQLARLLKRQYLNGDADALQMLLSGEDANQANRDLHFMTLLSRAKADLLGVLRDSLKEKQRLADATESKHDEITAIEQKRQQQHAALLSQQQQRQTILASLSDKIKVQRNEIDKLKRDEKRLEQLIDGLARIVARKSKPGRTSAHSGSKKRHTDNSSVNSEEIALRQERGERNERNEQEPEATGFQGNFAELKGRLRLPVRGELANRFGAPRADGGTTWKGLFIRAEEGTEVKAVAPGRIVFADWLRGFGNLLIVDHGDAFLTVYGNNQSLLRRVGETVKSGDTIAAVGNSGGNPESGLYFELRRQGQAIDPLKWASLR